MTIAIWALATYSIVATATHLGSILIATSKCRKPRSVSRPAESQTALGFRADALSAANRTARNARAGLHGRALRRRRRQPRAAGLRLGKPHRRHAAFRLPPRLSAL